jgi:hypothetical protein
MTALLICQNIFIVLLLYRLQIKWEIKKYIATVCGLAGGFKPRQSKTFPFFTASRPKVGPKRRPIKLTRVLYTGSLKRNVRQLQQ